MEKKSKELDCLRQAVTLGLRRRGKTKEFFKAVEAGLKDKESILDGERPDFIILTQQEQIVRERFWELSIFELTI